MSKGYSGLESQILPQETNTGCRGRRAAVNDCWGVFPFLLVWTCGQHCALTWGGPGNGAGLWEGEKNVNSDWVTVSLKILMKHLRGDEKAGNWTCHLTLGREAWLWEIKSIVQMVINTLRMEETTYGREEKEGQEPQEMPWNRMFNGKRLTWFQIYPEDSFKGFPYVFHSDSPDVNILPYLPYHFISINTHYFLNCLKVSCRRDAPLSLNTQYGSSKNQDTLLYILTSTIVEIGK